MFLSLGSDIIDIRRIKNTIKRYGTRFKKRCYHLSEITRSEKKLKSIESYAKRYAAKEACAKALGTGLAKGVFWKDIEIKNDNHGKPMIFLHKNAKSILNKNFGKDCKIEVSLSDEKNYAIANVIIYK